ncbi:MAG: hypothetical protein V3T70_03850 [Phycisphaerae bacterium]
MPDGMEDQAGPSSAPGKRVFVVAFIAMMVLGSAGYAFSLTPSGQDAMLSLERKWLDLEKGASEFAEAGDEHLINGRTLYFTEGKNGDMRPATEEEISNYKQWQDDMRQSMEGDDQIETYYNDR